MSTAPHSSNDAHEGPAHAPVSYTSDEHTDGSASPKQREGGPEQKSGFSARHLLLFAIIVLVIVLPIRLFVAKPFIVSGTSMYPAFDTFHYLIIDQVTYRLNEPKRGDVVVFRFPQNPSRFFIKRIIGLPGETVRLTGNSVTIINDEHPEGFVLDEPYVSAENERPSDMAVTLGDDEYFVMGDNRKASADSRYWGPLEENRIVGRAFIRLFPLTAVGLLPGDTKYEPAAEETAESSSYTEEE